MDERSELLLLEQRRCTAISTGDISALKALLSDDYVHVHMNAAVDDREGHLLRVAKNPRRTTRGEIRVQVYGDIAVLTGEQTNHMSAPREEARAVRAYCHEVAVRRDGAWRFVSIQLTPLQST